MANKKTPVRKASARVTSGSGTKRSVGKLFNKWVALVLVVIIFGGVGSYFLFVSHAATTPDTPLDFIKTANTPSGNVEIHQVSADSAYKTPTIAAATRFSNADSANGIMQMVGNDLYFIKERNTGSGDIEVHIATAASNYQGGGDYASAFPSSYINNGTFQMVGSTLYYIETSGTASGKVEVHALTGASFYQTYSVHAASGFAVGDGSNGIWQIMDNGDLAFVKTKGTPSGNVELHVVTAASGYATFSTHAVTYFTDADAANGWYSATDANNDNIPDVSFIKTKSTGSGSVEVFYAEGTNYGTPAVADTTAFSPADASNGTWQVGTPVIATPVPTASTSHGQAILNAALSKQGLPYVFAGGNINGPTSGGFDCSGLVMYAVYQGAHVVLPHKAQSQVNYGTPVAQANLQPGDIVFFPGSDGSKSAPGHVGIYYGVVNGKQTVVDAYESGAKVGLRSFSQEAGGFASARRF